MHEFSIALNIVDLATEAARKENASKISRVELELGSQSGIVIEALEFAWDPATKGTMLEHAELKIKEVQAKAECQDCKHIFLVKQMNDVCPKCKSYKKKLIEGSSIRILSLDIE